MARNRTLKVVAAIIVSFAGLAGVIIILLKMEIIHVTLAILMLVALLGMYVGIGAMIAVYHLIGKLD